MSRVVMQAHLRNELTNAKKSHTVFTDCSDPKKLDFYFREA